MQCGPRVRVIECRQRLDIAPSLGRHKQAKDSRLVRIRRFHQQVELVTDAVVPHLVVDGHARAEPVDGRKIGRVSGRTGDCTGRWSERDRTGAAQLFANFVHIGIRSVRFKRSFEDEITSGVIGKRRLVFRAAFQPEGETVAGRARTGGYRLRQHDTHAVTRRRIAGLHSPDPVSGGEFRIEQYPEQR